MKTPIFCFLTLFLVSLTSFADEAQEKALTIQVQNSMGEMIRCHYPLVSPGLGITVLAGHELNIWIVDWKYRHNFINPLITKATEAAQEDKNFDLYSLPEMQKLENTLKNEQQRQKCQAKQEQFLTDLLAYIQFFALEGRVSKGI